MKPYDKSNSFMRRVTKRVSELIPGTTWMNMLLGESQSSDDPTSVTENDDQPPVKKLCTSNNSFTSTNYRPCLDSDPSINSADNHKNSHLSVIVPEISAVTCCPSTSRQSPKFTSQSNTFLQGHDIGSRGSLKRKSDVADLSNVNRQTPKAIGFNFASSTPTLVTANKQQVATNSLKRLSSSNRLSTSNEFLTPTSSKLIKSRENESQSTLKFRESSKHLSSASFRWDTFVNYGELSERQKLFAQKSPLNCSQVMYGGNSARSNLSKILSNTPPIHRKAVIPISPTNNSEIRTTSSILLGHISTKDKEIEENKFIIQPKVHQRHKADTKTVPLVVETTVKLVETVPEKTDEKSNDILLSCPGRDSSRKLRANVSKKSRGLKFEELEMPAKVDLPNISLPMSVLPNIKLSSSIDDDNEFKFNQPLTIEQFSLQIAEKTNRKKHKMSLNKTQNKDVKYSSSVMLNQSHNILTSETSQTENNKVSIINKNNDVRTENLNKSDKVSELSKFGDDDSSKDISKNSNSKFEPEKNPVNMVFENSSLKIESSNKNQQSPQSDNSQKPLIASQLGSWTACSIPNKNEVDKIVESEPPIKKVVEQSKDWKCDACWVNNKSDSTSCIACGTAKPVNKVVEQSSTWTCDACWVKNKGDCTSCISCGTAKPGCVVENKLQPSTQFKFGLNNNTSEPSSSQFKFGFDSNKTDQSSSQFKFGSTTFQNSENGKTDGSIGEFKFGMAHNKTDQPLGTFKFGIDSTVSQSTKKPVEIPNSINSDQSESQFKFGFEKKSDQIESQFKFGQAATTNKPLPQFKFGFDNVDADKSIQQNVASESNKIAQSVNELKSLVNNKNEVSEKSTESQNKSIPFKFGSTILSEKPISQVTFGSVETNKSNSNVLSNNNTGLTTDESSKEKCVWDKKDKIDVKSINSGTSPTENTKTVQLVNGHSHSNETISNEDQKPGLIKVPQFFSFGSLAAKQDQNLPDDQKKKTFTFGSVANDTKSFVAPALATGSFSNTSTVFGASNSMFNSGSTTSASTTLGSSIPQFSFGSMAPPATNNLFTKTVKDNDKKSLAQTSNSFTSPNVGFSFGAQSPAFSVANTSGFMKSSIQANDQIKSTPNVIFNQSSIKQTVKLDPNAPISINFTGGATTQFTAKPETTEPPTKRKILKPVRRIR